jgi:very-short-patch-repair endonuclease
VTDEVENMALNPNFVKLSRQLRKKQTPWEKRLWARLKGKQFFGLKFKRQVVIGNYIVDFSCFEKMLIIELDGAGHSEDSARRSDERRTKFLEDRGYKVLRFYNNDIDNNLEGVLETIRFAVKK